MHIIPANLLKVKVKQLCIYIVEWSAPAAIGMAGLGGGFEIGAEVCSL